MGFMVDQYRLDGLPDRLVYACLKRRNVVLILLHDFWWLLTIAA